jgi:hypothetical protein
VGTLASPFFWKEAANSVGAMRTEGSLRYILLDKTYKMAPIVRNKRTTFTDFLATDAAAVGCEVIINGNFYDLSSKLLTHLIAEIGIPDDPADTKIEGRIVQGGKTIAGDSRPKSFWFAQLSAPTADVWPWIYAAGAGDPPTKASAAIGGAGPIIIKGLPYGVDNKYRPDTPSAIRRHIVDEPPPSALHHLIQRNNNMFKSLDGKPPETGKSILAYSSTKRMLMVAVQQHGMKPGQTLTYLASLLAHRGFDFAVFMDGSDSATLVLHGKIIVAPSRYKNGEIDVGIGFYR